jgi:hypothetical protein
MVQVRRVVGREPLPQLGSFGFSGGPGREGGRASATPYDDLAVRHEVEVPGRRSIGTVVRRDDEELLAVDEVEWCMNSRFAGAASGGRQQQD